MQKEAVTTLPLQDTIRQRWSPRAFAPKGIKEEDLATVFEAARWAPSCANEQNWQFVFAHHADKKNFELLCTLLEGGNNAWAPHAAVLVVSLANMRFEANGEENFYALHDVGMATQNLLLQATSMGIFGHPMAGFDRAKAKQLLQLPASIEPVCMIALGYPGDYTTLPEVFQKREIAPRQRKPLEDICKAFGHNG